MSDSNAETKEPPTQSGAGSGQPDSAARMQELESELASANDRLLRALAEMENVRRRADRERGEALKFAGSGLARDLLPAIDNLRRAIESVPQVDRLDEASRQLLAGVEATERAILDTLQKHGIQRIDPVGDLFDPHRHQAMYEEPSDERAPGTVTRVLQPGYMYHDRLLRPAVVGVARRDGDSGAEQS